ncbi:MAG: phage portal protein [Leptothrix sp. (in: b-proteobacteria)]
MTTTGSRILADWNAKRDADRRIERARTERAAQLAQPQFRPNRATAPGGAGHGQRRFDAAVSSRLTEGWISYGTSINFDLQRALPVLRTRSRDLVQNTEIGARFISLVKSNVVGATGPRLQVRAYNEPSSRNAKPALDVVANNAIEDHWARWCKKGVCDVTGKLSFSDICRAVIAAAARDGEFLVKRVRDRKRPYGYSLQLLDTARIDQLYLQQLDKARIIMGIEIDEFGKPQGYWLTTREINDGLATGPIVRQRVPAGEIFHDFLLDRAEQVRGIPWMHSVMIRMQRLSSYEDSALLAAEVGASKMGFYKQPEGGDPLQLADAQDAEGNLLKDVEPGSLETLPPGWDFVNFNPDYPQANFESFVSACLHGVASGLNLAAHNLTGDMSKVNYSSARVAELGERDTWKLLQQWFTDSFVRPVFEEWLNMALLTKAITLPSGAALPAERLDKFISASSFQSRGWQWVDPQKEVAAAILAVDNRFKSRRQVIEEQGGDFEDVLADLTLEQQLLDAAGLAPLVPPPSADTAAQATDAMTGDQAPAK